MASIMPRAKLSGVEGDLDVVTVPASSITTQSVKVPPISTPTRYEPMILPSFALVRGLCRTLPRFPRPKEGLERVDRVALPTALLGGFGQILVKPGHAFVDFATAGHAIE